MLQPKMRAILKSLPPALQSQHFTFHFGLRNPIRGSGMGAHGVRNKLIIVTYVEALETLYRAMTSAPWLRKPPVMDETNRTNVYVLNSSPFTAIDHNEVPYIVLSCRSNEPTSQAELHRAAAEAVHEGTHLFNYSQRPMHDPNSHAWVWFDEGLAMLMEMLVAPGNPDYFRFLMNWIDVPEMPLDDPDGHYQSGMFIRYLANKLGPQFVNDVWTKSKIKDGPIETMERLMPAGQKFISSNPDERDLFASGYCIDPYFIWDHDHPCVAPDVFLRYGERAISESRRLCSNDRAEISGQLDHLACRYYRFFLKGDVKGVEILFVPEDTVNSDFKAELVAVNKDTQRLKTMALRSNNNNGATGQLGVLLNDLDPDEIDHLVLVVSNCGKKSYQAGNGRNHDDQKNYTIHVSAS